MRHWVSNQMAMGGHLLELKQLGRLGLSSVAQGLARLPRLEKRRSCAKPNSCSIALGGERLRHGFVSLATNSNGWGGFSSGLGARAVFVSAAASDGEGREAEGVADEVAEELDLMENSTFLARPEELTSVNRRDPPNLFFYVSGESFLTSFVCCFMNFYLQVRSLRSKMCTVSVCSEHEWFSRDCRLEKLPLFVTLNQFTVVGLSSRHFQKKFETFTNQPWELWACFFEFVLQTWFCRVLCDCVDARRDSARTCWLGNDFRSTRITGRRRYSNWTWETHKSVSGAYCFCDRYP